MIELSPKRPFSVNYIQGVVKKPRGVAVLTPFDVYPLHIEGVIHCFAIDHLEVCPDKPERAAVGGNPFR